VIVDLGTGDGAAVVQAARSSPEALVIGVDANAAGLVDVSRRAARPLRKGGLPNALFLSSDATEALKLLEGQLDELRITLPWGSLLRWVLSGERAFALAVAGSL
jgi:16S rRNA (adenine(1408)-N(1))-methyltransferase